MIAEFSSGEAASPVIKVEPKYNQPSGPVKHTLFGNFLYEQSFLLNILLLDLPEMIGRAINWIIIGNNIIKARTNQTISGVIISGIIVITNSTRIWYVTMFKVLFQ